MKEGIGGTFMIYVLLVFLAVYITFVAVAFNYARAFRVKNKVIDIIEQNEGIGDYRNTSDNAMVQINEYLGQVSYNESENVTSNNCPNYVSGDDNHYFNTQRGYCVQRITASNSEYYGEYYKVTTFITLKIPFLNIGFTIPVKGETRKIERINT